MPNDLSMNDETYRAASHATAPPQSGTITCPICRKTFWYHGGRFNTLCLCLEKEFERRKAKCTEVIEANVDT